MKTKLDIENLGFKVFENTDGTFTATNNEKRKYLRYMGFNFDLIDRLTYFTANTLDELFEKIKQTK